VASEKRSIKALRLFLGAVTGVFVLSLVAWVSPIVAFLLAALAWAGYVVYDETKRSDAAPQFHEITLTIRLPAKPASRVTAPAPATQLEPTKEPSVAAGARRAREGRGEHGAAPLVHGAATASRIWRSEASLLGA
jgi:hypothetical protein